MPCGTFTVKNVPQAKLQQTIDLFKANKPPPQDVTSEADGAGTFTQTVAGTELTAYFNVDFVPNWSVTVQAHNAFGWGPSSSVFTLGGL